MRLLEWPRTVFFGTAWLCFVAWTASAADLRLIQAVKNGDIKAARQLIAERVDVQGAEADGSTALAWAAQRDNLELVDLLIGAGAHVNAANRYNVTPLALACTNGK